MLDQALFAARPEAPSEPLYRASDVAAALDPAAPAWARRLHATLMRRHACRRGPDFTVHQNGRPYLQRWWVVPKNRRANLYFHRFLLSDEDRALHDHPWISASIILAGGYLEHMPGGIVAARRPGQVSVRGAASAHRVELIPENGGLRPAWTLFATGPHVRQWGFLCPGNWKHNRDFNGGDDTGATVGKGCDD